MNWESLLSLKRFGDSNKRLRIEQDDLRLGFEVDYDRIVFSNAFRSLQDKTQVIPFSPLCPKGGFPISCANAAAAVIAPKSLGWYPKAA